MEEYNDAYALLAHYIIAYYSAADIKRVLFSDEFVQKIVIRELREQDLKGPFLDAIIEELITDKKRKELNCKLDMIAEYLFGNLDLDRLRGKIIEYVSKYNIMEL